MANEESKLVNAWEKMIELGNESLNNAREKQNWLRRVPTEGGSALKAWMIEGKRRAGENIRKYKRFAKLAKTVSKESPQ